MKKSAFTNFLHWWIVFILIITGSVIAQYFGLFKSINNADVTKISFLIYAIFLIFTVRVGIHSYRFGKTTQSEKDADDYLFKQEAAWFYSDELLTLGLWGTILGFIYMLAISFSILDPTNQATLKVALKGMGVGMSTALYTTAVGIICSALLKLQLFHFTHYLETIIRRENTDVQK